MCASLIFQAIRTRRVSPPTPLDLTLSEAQEQVRERLPSGTHTLVSHASSECCSCTRRRLGLHILRCRILLRVCRCACALRLPETRVHHALCRPLCAGNMVAQAERIHSLRCTLMWSTSSHAHVGRLIAGRVRAGASACTSCPAGSYHESAGAGQSAAADSHT